MANEHASRSHRRSSVVFPNEPDSERGAFLNFLEESGANAILMDAFRALYDCPEKPDAPLQWLRNYFRQQAPSRSEEIKEMKETMRRDLLELQASIYVMQEEAERKEELIKALQGAKGDADYEPVSPLPEREEYFSEANKALRADTRWRLQPHPFMRASCSAEEVIPAKDLEVIHAAATEPSVKSGSVAPEDYGDDEDEHTLILPTTAEDEDEDDDDDDYPNERKKSDEDWVKAYNVYKKTSQLPDLNNPNPAVSAEAGKGTDRTVTLDPTVRAKVISTGILKDASSHVPPHPDALPPNLWVPGFHLVTDLNHPESSDSEAEMMIDHENDEVARTKSEFYYKASRGNSRYVLRPQRDQIIYENEWNLWNSIEGATGAGNGSSSGPLKRSQLKRSNKAVHGADFNNNNGDLQTAGGGPADSFMDPVLPSTNSAQLGSSMRNLVDVLLAPTATTTPRN